MATPTASGAAPTSTPCSVLVGLEGDLVRTLQSVKKGVAMLDERRAALVDDADAAFERRPRASRSSEEDEPETAVR